MNTLTFLIYFHVYIEFSVCDDAASPWQKKFI